MTMQYHWQPLSDLQVLGIGMTAGILILLAVRALWRILKRLKQ
jgi:hypothetical protein